MPYRPPGHTSYVTDRKMRPRKEEGLTQDHTENQDTKPGLESGALVWDKFHPRQTQGNMLLGLQMGYPG